MKKTPLPSLSLPKLSLKGLGTAGVNRLRITLLASTAVVLALVGLALQQGLALWLPRVTAEQTAITCSGLADALGARVAQLQSRMRAWAQDPELAEALRAKHTDQALSTLQQAFPEAWKARLLPAGFDRVDESDTPPLGFGLLQMILEAEHSLKAQAAEAQSVGTDKANVALIQPILDAGGKRTIGHLVVQIKLADLTRAIGTAQNVPARITLHQRIGRGRDLVLYDNRRGPAPGDSAAPLSVPDTQWELHCAPDPQAARLGATEQAMLFGALGVGFVLLNGLVFLLTARFSTALHTDLRTLVEAIKDWAVKQRKPRLPRPNLADMTSTFIALQELDRAPDLAMAELAEGDNLGEVLDLDTEVGVALSLGDDREAPAAESPPLFDESGFDAAAARNTPVPAEIFRAYDIRGIADKVLSSMLVYRIGLAIGSEAYAQGQQSLIVGRDGRKSSPLLAEALTRGLLASGRDVTDIGLTPTPVLNFATHFLGTESAVMVTGSHNPPDYNGLKIVIRNEALSGEAIQALRRRVEAMDIVKGQGNLQRADALVPDYIERIGADCMLLRPLKVVIDCGNAVGSLVAPQLLQRLGCEVHELYCEVDGNFPHHHPDPGDPDNLQDLCATVSSQGADLGLAFDGDGDRLGVVSDRGEIVWPDRVLMLLAQDVLSRNPGAIILYDVKSSAKLAKVIQGNAGRPLMWKPGHSFMREKMEQSGALLGGEMSGHIFFKERWFGFDDAFYSAARLLEILGREERPLSDLLAELPQTTSTPELRIPLPEGRAAEIMAKLAEASFPDAHVNTLDGIRAEYPTGWGLVRASNTTPALTLRFEADNNRALRRIQDTFRERLLGVDPSLNLPF
jgi:phosphomannomutase/phosphoglucomutase